MTYESDNPQFDHLINNMDSDEVVPPLPPVASASSAYSPVAPFVTGHEDVERAAALLPPWATSWATQQGDQHPDHERPLMTDNEIPGNANSEQFRVARNALIDEQDEKRVGIIGKYRVERVSDPEGKHADCWYFVLDPTHDPIAREALLTYATEAREQGYQALHDDILDRLAALP